MTELFAAVGLFLFFHLLPAIRPLRTGLISRIGRPAYFTIFSAISIAATVWLFMAYIEAPYVEVWAYQPWARWAALLVMPVSCILTVVGLASANPFSLTLNTNAFDPARPGIIGVIRHPAVLGLGLWSAVHMLPNGDAASLTMFGLLTLLSVSGPRTLTRRRKAGMGEDAWGTLNENILKPTWTDVIAQIGVLKILGGLVLYGALLFLHEPVIGISPLAG